MERIQKLDSTFSRMSLAFYDAKWPALPETLTLSSVEWISSHNLPQDWSGLWLQPVVCSSFSLAWVTLVDKVFFSPPPFTLCIPPAPLHRDIVPSTH